MKFNLIFSEICFIVSYHCIIAIQSNQFQTINNEYIYENPIENIHDSMMKLAMKDAYAQQELANKARMQMELFQKAQEYAKEIGIQELKAKQYANEVNLLTQKAQFARGVMFNAFKQIKEIEEHIMKGVDLMSGIKIIKEEVVNVNEKDNNININTSNDDYKNEKKGDRKMILNEKKEVVVFGKHNGYDKKGGGFGKEGGKEKVEFSAGSEDYFMGNITKNN
jgi:hypothetical protein